MNSASPALVRGHLQIKDDRRWPSSSCLSTAQRLIEPAFLLVSIFLQDARVDCDERKAIGLHLEEGRALKPGRDAILPAQARRFLNQVLDPAFGRARHAQIGFDPRVDAGASGIRLEKCGVETFEGVVPIVIAGNRIDRPGDAFERQPEFRLVVTSSRRLG